MDGKNEDYHPGNIVDVTSIDTLRIALDGAYQRVWLFGSDFQHISQWGREGEGPNEFRNAVAVTADPSDSTLLIAETRPPALTRYTVEGEVLARRQISHTPSSIAVDRDGLIYVTHPTITPMVRRMETWPLVTTYTAELQPADTALSLSPEMLGESPFRTFDVNPSLGIPSGGKVPVLFPYENTVAILQAGRHIFWVRGCIPDALDSYYREFGDTDEGGGAVILASDVRVTSDGKLEVISTTPTAGGDHHIDIYGREGEALGSLLLRTGRIDLPNTTRFFTGDDRIFIFRDTGMLADVEYYPR